LSYPFVPSGCILTQTEEGELLRDNVAGLISQDTIRFFWATGRALYKREEYCLSVRHLWHAQTLALTGELEPLPELYSDTITAVKSGEDPLTAKELCDKLIEDGKPIACPDCGIFPTVQQRFLACSSSLLSGGRE
jgi:hypothetical protein